MSIYRQGDLKPLLIVPDFDAGLGSIRNQSQRQMAERHRHFGIYDKRLHLFPEARLLVVIPHGNDHVVWQRVNWQSK